ncbi:MAG: dihydropyrimidinase [Solirubrobacteraceae bacterium]|nr:dihydropyrimidinase [Solirubrobacteraceae bacterium]
MTTTLIQGGTVVTSAGRFAADVLTVDGRIGEIATSIARPADHIVDARGQYVIPGGVDPHAHVKITFGGVPSADDFTSATIAAAFGGTTTIIDFAFQEHGQSLSSTLDDWHAALAASPPVTDVGVHLMISDLTDPAWIDELRAAPATGVSSFKLFMAYRGSFMVGDPAMWDTMRVAAETGALVMVHAENGDAIDALIREAVAADTLTPPFHASTRPRSTEAEAVNRALMFAELTGARTFIVHVSCADAVAPIVGAKARGMEVWGETCPQYLLFDESIYEQPLDQALRGIFSPPARSVADQDALWTALAGVGLDVISTDHSAFNLALRHERYESGGGFTAVPNGGPGLEERLALMFDVGVRGGRISLEQWVDLCCTTPARLFGLGGRKGVVAVGADADLVVWDPERERTLGVETAKSKVDYSMHEGRVVTGAPSTVIVDGVPLIADGELLDQPKRGFLRRAASVEATASV